MSGPAPGERLVEVGGNRLHIAVDGHADGPWLTLLNSLAADMRMWEPQIGPLGKAFRLLRIDARGHGRSSADNPPR